MKERSRYTKLFALLFAGFFALAFTILPHHHHHDGRLCIGIISSLEQEKTTDEVPDNDCCEEDCVIRISDAVCHHGAEQLEYYTLPLISFVEKLFTPQFEIPIFETFLPSSVYCERLHAVFLTSSVSLRAPPTFIA